MYKTALVGLAALSLSACASRGPLNALNAAAPFPAKVEATALDIAEAPIVVADRAGEPEAVAMMASPALMRRNFGSPTRRQPDLRLVLATAVDRARFSPRRRAWRRRA